MHRWWHRDAQLAFHPVSSVTVSLNLSATECTETFLNLQKMCVGAVGETHVGPVWDTFAFLCFLHWTHVQADEFPSRRIIQTLSFHCCIPDASRPGKNLDFSLGLECSVDPRYERETEWKVGGKVLTRGEKRKIISVLLKIDEERSRQEKRWELKKWWVEYKESDVHVRVWVCEAGSIQTNQ